MAINNYTLDGIQLMDPDGRWFYEKTTGIRIIPAKRNTSLSYPGVDGEQFVPGATYSPGGVLISLYIKGTTHNEFMEIYEFWAGVISQRHRTLPLVHHYFGEPDTATDRVANVQITSSVEPRLINNKPLHALLEIPCSIPGVFWRSANEVSSVNYAAPSVQTTHTLSQMGNAPLVDAKIRIKGGFSQLDMWDPVSGAALSINKAVASDRWVIIDPVQWRASEMTSGTSWDLNSGTDMSMFVDSNRGRGPMFEIAPDFSQGFSRHRFTVATTNPSGSPTVMIQTKRAYL